MLPEARKDRCQASKGANLISFSLMATEEKTTLPYYTSESKSPGVDHVVVQNHRQRRKGLRWALGGTILTYLVLRTTHFVVQKQSQGGWEAFRPHRIPPKVAEGIFLWVSPRFVHNQTTNRMTHIIVVV